MLHHVRVYTKSGCHLCEEARALLQELRVEFPLIAEEVDIERNHDLFKEYFDKIPVLIIDARITLAAPIRKEDLRAALISLGTDKVSLP